MTRIRSFFQYGTAPDFRLAMYATNVLDSLERALQNRQPLLGHGTTPAAMVTRSLRTLTGSDDSEAIIYPLRGHNDLNMQWSNTLGESIGKRMLDNLLATPGYGEWEQVWGGSSLVTDLVDMTMGSPSVVQLTEPARRQVRHSIDQSLYHLLGFYLGNAAVGRRDNFGPLDTICRHLVNGVPLGRSDEYWSGWLIAGN